MCLIVVGIDAHPAHPLVLAANRDEVVTRASAPLGPWPERPDVLGGRDLEAGGAWLGVRADGRWAALTNVRDPRDVRTGARTRGDLVRDALAGDQPLEAFVRDVQARVREYNGFNLLVGHRTPDPGEAAATWFVSSRESAPVGLPTGVYGLSNDTLDVPWPKVVRTRERFEAALAGPRVTADALLDLLDDRDPAPDELLPDTGVGLTWERILSPPRIVTEGYGTRASTAVVLHADGAGEVAERTWLPGGGPGELVRMRIG